MLLLNPMIPPLFAPQFIVYYYCYWLCNNCYYDCIFPFYSEWAFWAWDWDDWRTL